MERDQLTKIYFVCCINFNSHAHVERDDKRLVNITNSLLFQLTRSRGAWPRSFIFSVIKWWFQLTRSRGAWLRYRCHSQKCKSNFNSHAHVERDDICTEHFVNFFISTHTLTWSVTPNNYTDKINLNISTHTLTWSVTFCSVTEICTTHISTHTLTWSVTWKLTDKCALVCTFQLTRSRGAWRLISRGFYL